MDDQGTFDAADDVVAGFVLAPDAGVGDLLGIPGVRPGASLETVRARVEGLTEDRFEAEPALARTDGDITTVFVQKRSYRGPEQCRLMPEVGVIAMVTPRSRPLVERFVGFDCDPGIDYD